MSDFKFILVFLLYSCSIFGQDVTEAETTKVFSYLVADKRQVFLSAQIDTFSLKRIQKELSKSHFIRRFTRDDTLHVDTLLLSQKERKYIDNCLTSLASYKWTNNEMKQNGLAQFTVLDNTQTKRYPNHDIIVYEIAKPIFLRSNTVAFTYYSYACGSLCGHEALTILKKREGKWQKWWTIFHSDS